MAVTPINIARVSQNLKAFNLLSTVRASQLGLFRVQNQLATGLKFLTPSQDPAGAAKTQALDSTMERITQLQANVRDASATLLAGETAMQDAINLLTEASVIASENVNDTVEIKGNESSKTYYRVQKLNASQQSLVLRLHTAATLDDKATALNKKAHLLRGNKVLVDPLGVPMPCND